MQARAALYVGPRDVRITDVDLPLLGRGEMLVEVVLAGVDGSEIHMYRGEIDRINELAPLVLGDELVGRVVELGPETSEHRQLKLGDLVVVEARWPCTGCRNCQRGQYYLCERHAQPVGYGWVSAREPPHLWGAFATHAFVPAEALVYRVPDELEPPTALLAGSVLANSLRWTGVTPIDVTSHVVVIGPGPQGIGCALLAAMRGAEVSVVGLPRDELRLDTARRYGATRTVTLAADGTDEAIAQVEEATQGRPVDVVIEAAGAQGAKDLAVALVRKQGTVVNISLTTPRHLTVDWFVLLLKEVTLLNPHSHPHTIADALQLATRLVGTDRDPAGLISHVFPLEDVTRALTVAAQETAEPVVKVALDPHLPPTSKEA